MINIPTNHSNNVLIDELKQDVERERWATLWQRHRYLIIGAFMLVVLATAAHSYWKHMTAQQNMELTTALYNAFGPEGKADPATAAASLLGFATDNADTHAAFMAQMQAASLRIAADDIPGALAALEGALATKDADANLLAIATLNYVQIGLDTQDPVMLQGKLQPYVNDTSAYRFQAWELAALLAYRQKDVAAAQEYLTKIIDDKDVPVTARRRAMDLQRVLI